MSPSSILSNNADLMWTNLACTEDLLFIINHFSM
jgi:hypothetical protein